MLIPYIFKQNWFVLMQLNVKVQKGKKKKRFGRGCNSEEQRQRQLHKARRQ